MKVKKGIKPLQSSLRESNRYIGFEVISKEKVSNFSTVRDSIENSYRNLFGDISMAESGLMAVKNAWNEGSQRGVIKVERKFADNVKAGLAMISEIKGQNVILRSLTTSGMINKVKKNISQGG